MSTDFDQLAKVAAGTGPTSVPPFGQKQRTYERRRRHKAVTALATVQILFLVGVGTSCGDGVDTPQGVVAVGIDDREGPHQQTDDPPVELPVELVEVPDVIGLSSSEAHARLEPAGFSVEVAIDAIPKAELQPDTVTGSDPFPGTQVSFGSLVVLDIYADSSMIDAEDLARIRITQEVKAEFGDRVAMGYWDKTTATFYVRIADLSASESEQLNSRYNDEAITVVIFAVGIGDADMRALNQSTKDLVHAFLAECENTPSYSVGINVASWAVVVNLPVDDAEGQSITECISQLREAVLANAAQFAEERSILADPADLVRFRADPIQPLDILRQQPDAR